MSKGEQTRQRILRRASWLLNRYGYLSSPISEIMRVTGLKKGGLYNHFKSKEDLALQAFDYAVEMVVQKMTLALVGKQSSLDRLIALISVFREYGHNSCVGGGCPVMNCAIESDDANPVMRKQARLAMDRLRDLLLRIINKGIERGEIRANVDAEIVTTIFISMLEGAVMLSNLYKDPVHLVRVINYLEQYTHTDLKA